MTEPTIICPNCKTEIRLTESLAAPLIEAVRKQYEQQLTQKDTDIAKREQAMREKEKQLATAKTTLDEQVATQVEEQLKKDRARITADEARKAKQAAAIDLEQKVRELTELQEVLKRRDEKLAEAQNAQADLIRKQRELDDAKRELELTVQKRIQEGLALTRQEAKKEAEDELNLKVKEKDQTIASMQQKIEELKRRAEQGSQQLQGDPPIKKGATWEEDQPESENNVFKIADRTAGLVQLFNNHDTVKVYHSQVTLEYDLADVGDLNASLMADVWKDCFKGSPGTFKVSWEIRSSSAWSRSHGT